VALVTFAFLASSLPQAAAQEPARPEPRELWRQFPLDPERSNPEQPAQNQQAPAEPGRAPAPAPADRGAEAEGSAFSLPTAWITALVLAAALVLVLTFGARLREMRRAAAKLRKRIVAKAAALRSNVGERTGPADTEGMGEAAAVGERLALYVSPAKSERPAADEPASPEAITEGKPASTSDPTEDEVEILKAKLARSAAPVGVERPDEVETLKAKLVGNAAAAEDDATTHDVLKTKLEERGAPAKSLPRETDEAESLKAKLDVRDEAEAEHAPAFVEADTRGAAADEPQPRRAAGQRPVSRGRASSVARGSTAAAPRRASHRAERGALGAAPHLEPVPAPSPLPTAPVRSEQPRPRPSECRIAWWRGYVKSAFHAVETTADEEQLVAESSFFRWRKPEPPPQSGSVAEAHRALVERLQGEGWSVVGTGEHWFALQLQRPRANGDASRSGGSDGSTDR
jgi:hypothetical protein